MVDRGRCSEHESNARRRHWEATRAYSSRGHRAFRDAVLRDSPICALCPALATIADHFPRSRRELEELRLDPNNPQYGRALCKSCHDSETATHQPGGWNRRDA